MICPDCDRPAEEHFTFGMTAEELLAWHNNELVCTRFRGDLLTESRSNGRTH